MALRCSAALARASASRNDWQHFLPCHDAVSSLWNIFFENLGTGKEKSMSTQNEKNVRPREVPTPAVAPLFSEAWRVRLRGALQRTSSRQRSARSRPPTQTSSKADRPLPDPADPLSADLSAFPRTDSLSSGSCRTQCRHFRQKHCDYLQPLNKNSVNGNVDIS